MGPSKHVAEQADESDWRCYGLQIDSNPSEAAEYLEKCLTSSATLTSEQRDHLVSEAAYFTAEHRADPCKAETWFNRITDPKKLHTLTVLRVRIATLSSAGKLSDALQACDEGILYLRQFSANPRKDDGVNLARLASRAETTRCNHVVTSPRFSVTRHSSLATRRFFAYPCDMDNQESP